MKHKKEEEFFKQNINNNNNNLKNTNKTIPKKNKKKKKKHPIRRLFFFNLVIMLLLFLPFLIIKFYTFQKLAREMFNNTPSSVYDSNKNVIAKIGAERNRNNVNFENIPIQLINAYISIEDKRFYSHHRN